MAIVNPDAGFRSTPSAPPAPTETPLEQFARENGLSIDEAKNVLYGLPLPRTNSGGGDAGPDHFFDVNPLDQAMFDHKVKQDAIDNDLAQAQFQADQAWRDHQVALDNGNFALAQQKQQDYNHWQGVQAQLDQQRAQIQAEGQQLQFQVGMANVAARQQEAQLQYQVGMANASNDAERNQIQREYNAQIREIAVMEDATKRLLGGQQNQTAQFGAETQRQVGLGNLALDTNRFLLEAATAPENLPALFLMQRGYAPDFATIGAGGTPAQGQALVPRDPFSVYTPQTAAPTFNQQNPGGTPQISAAPPASSPNAVRPVQQAPAPAPQQVFDLTGDMRNYRLPAPTPAATPRTTAPAPGGFDVQIRQPGAGEIGPGNTLWTQIGHSTQPAAPTIYEGASTPTALRSPDISYGNDNQMHQLPPANINKIVDSVRFAGGGMTNARTLMVGDAAAANPMADGARPEIVNNPTGAPLEVVPNPRTLLDLFGPDGMKNMPKSKKARMKAMANGVKDAAVQNSINDRMMDTRGKASNIIEMLRQMYAHADRYALGTDPQAAYAAAGLGGLYIPDSSNTYLAGTELPDRLKGLVDMGYPLAPATAAAATGQLAPQLNLGNAARERGIGALPSLQALARGTKSEVAAEKGRIQTIGGIPFADAIDFIRKPTEFFRQAQTSRAA